VTDTARYNFLTAAGILPAAKFTANMPIDLRKTAAAIAAAVDFTAVANFHPDNLTAVERRFFDMYCRMDADARHELQNELREMNDGAIFAADFLPLFRKLPPKWQHITNDNLAQNYE